MTLTNRVVFLLDVDDTLLDNDAAQAGYLEHIKLHYGPEAADRYWAIFTELFQQLGYADYLGALQLFRLENQRDQRLLGMSSFLLEYPFADLLYPRALEVLKHLGQLAPTVILSDGDIVFQPRKIERSGIRTAVAGRVLIYVHKEEELEEIEQAYPAEHYVLIDDKLRILSAVKDIWGPRVTTVQPLQGHYAMDPKLQIQYPPADITVNEIGDLIAFDLGQLIAEAQRKAEVRREGGGKRASNS
jgi:FMN phosphatase YigB (HAD superfamily)